MKTAFKLIIRGLLFAGICIAFSSCRLDGHTLVEGKLVDFYSGKPVANGWVAVYGYDATTGGSFMGWGGGSGMRFMTEARTDASGNFNFQFDGDLDAPYSITAGINQGEYRAGQTEENEIKRRRNNKDMVIRFKKPLPVIIHMKDVGAPNETIIRYGDYTTHPEVTFLNVKDTVIYRTLHPVTNPYTIYYRFDDRLDNKPEERIRVDVQLPIPDDTVRLNIYF